MIGIEDWHPTGFVLNDTTEIENLTIPLFNNDNSFKNKYSANLLLYMFIFFLFKISISVVSFILMILVLQMMFHIH